MPPDRVAPGVAGAVGRAHRRPRRRRCRVRAVGRAVRLAVDEAEGLRVDEVVEQVGRPCCSGCRGSAPGSGSWAWRRRPAGSRPARSARAGSAARAGPRRSRPARRSGVTSEIPPACDRSGCTTAMPAVSAGQEVGRARRAVHRWRSGPDEADTSAGSRWACSGSTRLLDEQRAQRGDPRGSTRRALAALTRPWKSTATSRCGPSTSRAAATRSTTAAISAGAGDGARAARRRSS